MDRDATVPKVRVVVIGFVYAMSIVLNVVGTFLLIFGTSVTMCGGNGSQTQCFPYNGISLFYLYIYNSIPRETAKFDYTYNILGLALLVIGFALIVIVMPRREKKRRLAVSLILVGALILLSLLASIFGSITDCGNSCQSFTSQFGKSLDESPWFVGFFIIDMTLLAYGIALMAVEPRIEA